MCIRDRGYIELPRNQGKGGFDHAGVHLKSQTLYVAHTSNNSLDVIDCHQDKYLRSIPDLLGVAGVLVSNENEKVFTSNRGAVFDPTTERFYVNIADPREIAILDAKDPDGLLGSYQIPAAGPHGLDLDPRGRRLFCACDEGRLYAIDLESEKVSEPSKLVGPPDVIFYNSELDCLYVTVGDPAVIQVFDTKTMSEIQTVRTELGTHTIAFNKDLGKVYAFMPETHRASVYEET